MRITCKIATAGSSGLSRFPIPQEPLSKCETPDGHLDYAKAIAALRDTEGITFGSDDDRGIVAFAMEYLKQIESVVKNLAKDHNGEIITDGTTAKDRYCKRRMKTGRYAFVRTDISCRADGLRIALSWSNPRNIVGETENVSKTFSLVLARILIYLEGELGKNGTRLILVEGENCKGIFPHARKINQWFIDRDAAQANIDTANAQREQCPHLINGFCSPIHPKCQHYRDGRCQPLSMPDNFPSQPKQ